MVQEIAMAAMRQGASGCERLALAGSAGEQPQNLQRALLSFFTSHMILYTLLLNFF